MSWSIAGESNDVRILLSPLLPNECRVFTKFDRTWHELYSGSKRFLEDMSTAYALTKEIDHEKGVPTTSSDV